MARTWRKSSRSTLHHSATCTILRMAMALMLDSAHNSPSIIGRMNWIDITATRLATAWKFSFEFARRIIEIDFLRATEAAALNSLKWLGRGDKEAADAAASDAIRGMFDLMNICGEVVIGEGIKDNAPGIFKGEQLGTWLPGTPQFDIAIDPIDGTTNISKGAPNSISCIAAASPEEGVKVALRDVPSFYMTKLSYGPRVIQYMQRP